LNFIGAQNVGAGSTPFVPGAGLLEPGASFNPAAG